MKTISSIDIDQNKKLLLVDLLTIDLAMEKRIDSTLVAICEGEGSDLPRVKSRLLSFLSRKTQETAYGAVAEFFLHLYLREMGLTQDCMFFNLEESSIKKGFDGVFSYVNETYFMESKSSSFTSKNVSHTKNIKLAHGDLVDYLRGKSKKGFNNPWRNAYNHACHADVGSKKPLRDKLRGIADLYDKGKYQDPSDFNLIPCSTIYSDKANFIKYNIDINNNFQFISDMQGKSVTSICITSAAYSAFISYLEGF